MIWLFLIGLLLFIAGVGHIIYAIVKSPVVGDGSYCTQTRELKRGASLLGAILMVLSFVFFVSSFAINYL